MKLMSMEESTRAYEVAIFSIVCSKYGHLTAAMSPYVFEVRIQDDFRACSLTADKVNVIENGYSFKT